MMIHSSTTHYKNSIQSIQIKLCSRREIGRYGRGRHQVLLHPQLPTWLGALRNSPHPDDGRCHNPTAQSVRVIVSIPIQFLNVLQIGRILMGKVLSLALTDTCLSHAEECTSHATPLVGHLYLVLPRRDHLWRQHGVLFLAEGCICRRRSS